MAATAGNGANLWIKQAGEGDDVLFISGLGDEGACWVDPHRQSGHEWDLVPRRPLSS